MCSPHFGVPAKNNRFEGHATIFRRVIDDRSQAPEDFAFEGHAGARHGRGRKPRQIHYLNPALTRLLEPAGQVGRRSCFSSLNPSE